MAIGNMHRKFGEERTCSSEDMIAQSGTHTQTHTHRQTDTLIAHRSTPLTYRGRSN